jgi:hypothetical protein
LGFGIQEVSMAGPIITTYIIAFTQNPNSIWLGSYCSSRSLVLVYVFFKTD